MCARGLNPEILKINTVILYSILIINTQTSDFYYTQDRFIFSVNFVGLSL